MAALFSENSFSFIWKLYTLFIYVNASWICREDLDLLCGLVASDGKIILKKFNRIPDGLPYVGRYLCERFKGYYSELSFELCPNFSLNPKFFIDVLNKDDLEIKICFDDELKELVRLKIVKSSKYVNKILMNLPHKQNLKDLNLRSLKLTEVPEMIYKFKNLRSLNLEYNDLNNFEFKCNGLCNLTSLKIGFSEMITRIDESIFNLISLKTLEVRACAITEIPFAINKLRNLRELQVLGCPIKSISKSISNLENLKILNISNCALEEMILNMIEHPKLQSVQLCSNYSLKTLKLVILEIPHELRHFEIIDCPIEEVEIWLKLKNTRFGSLNRQNLQLEDVDYVIKYNLSEILKFRKIQKASEFKTYEFCISTSYGLNKTISIKEFYLEKTKTMATVYKLIEKWYIICTNINSESQVELFEEFSNSFVFLNNLYEIENCDYSVWFNNFPFEYKDKMITILFEIFDKLNEKNLESQVRSILKIFKRPCSEQLICFNFISKYSKFSSCEKGCLTAFVRESFEILKDLTFTIFLNSERYQYAESLRFLIRCFGDKKEFPSIILESKVFKELLDSVINAKKNFDSKFTVDYFLDIIVNVIARMDSLEFFNEEATTFFLENWDNASECFEYETQANVDIITKLNTQGMKILVGSILDGRIS